MSDQVQWQILGELAHANIYWRSRLRVKKHQDKFKWPRTPWEKRDDDAAHYGKVAPQDRGAAATYLLALSPKG